MDSSKGEKAPQNRTKHEKSSTELISPSNEDNKDIKILESQEITKETDNLCPNPDDADDDNRVIVTKSIQFEPKHQELWIYKSPKEVTLPEIEFLQHKRRSKLFKAACQDCKQASKAPKSKPPMTIRVGRVYELTADNRLKMKQPFKVLVDIWDVLVPRSFHETLNAYVDSKIYQYIEKNLDSELCKRVWDDIVTNYSRFFTQIISLPPMKRTDPREVQIEAFVQNINYRRRNPVFQGGQSFQEIVDEIWLDGYTTKQLSPPLYDDVLKTLKVWNAEPLFIKVYTLATGSAPYQKTFLEATEFGKPDYQYLIKDNFNSQNRYKFLLFSQVASAVNEWNPQNLFYVTSSLTRAKESSKARLTPVLLLRDGFQRYPKEKVESENFITIHKLNDLEFYEFGRQKNECC